VPASGVVDAGSAEILVSAMIFLKR